jgi:hypothetical protein
MVRNAGPPSSQSSNVAWALCHDISVGSPALAPLVASAGVAASGFLSYPQEVFGRRPVVLDGIRSSNR